MIASTSRLWEEGGDWKRALLNRPPRVIRLNDQRGYIDKQGHTVITPQFFRANAFEEGIARVEVKPDLWGYIRRDGSFIWNPVPSAGHRSSRARRPHEGADTVRIPLGTRTLVLDTNDPRR